MTVPNGILTIEKMLDGAQSPPVYIFSLENSVAVGGIACAITSPTAGATVTQGTPVTITGSITAPGTVVVKLGSTTLGSATMSGLTWSYAWTPQVGDVGGQTLNATATASVGGSTATAPGVAITVAASGGVAYAALLPGAYQVVQTDLGLTYGTTPKASGTSPPVATLSGTLTKDGAVPLLFKCTTGGAIGSAVFAAYVDGAGTGTPIMTGITPAAGTPIAITGSAVLSGISVAWAAGTANVDNVWKATASALADQSGNTKHYSQATAAKQPVITIGLNGKCGLLFDGVDDCLDSALNLPDQGTTPWSMWFVFRQTTWSTGTLVSCVSADSCLIAGISSSPALYMYAGAAGPQSAGAVVGTWTRADSYWSKSASDHLKLGSANNAVSAGTFGPGTGRRIGGRADGASFYNFEMLSWAHVPGVTPNLDASINSAPGYGVAGIAV